MIELKIQDLSCDKCKHYIKGISFDQYPKYINYSCPKCGTNMLTQSQYDSCLHMKNIVDKYNKVSNVLKWINPLFYYRKFFGDKRELNTVKIVDKSNQ